MVGKIKHVRQKLHHEAVKLDGPSRPSSLNQPTGSALSPVLEKPPASERLTTTGPSVLENNHRDSSRQITQSCLPSGIFAGTKISPVVLVQTLKLEDPPDGLGTQTLPATRGPEEKKVNSKKEKMKERRERWLNKISSIKQAKEQQAAEARRQATPVVGDMRPLADALPELCQLVAPTPTAPTTRRKSRKNKVPVKRPEPTDFSQMKQSQKRKLLETETSWYSSAVKTLSAKMNPLADIGEQLRKRMRQEEDQDPS